MKKVILLTVTMLIGTVTDANAQFRVLSDGSSTSSSLTVNGIMGRGGKTGALTVGSDEVHPLWNSLTGDEPVVLSLKTSSKGTLPLSVYYSGTKVFCVDYLGNATGSGFVTTSDSICKTEIEVLQSPLQKLGALHGVSYRYKADDGQMTMRTANRQLGATPEISAQIEEELTRKRIGLIAQEVEKVFPEVVRTQFDGTKGILYSDLVGVLIEAVNDLQDSLSTQGAQIATLQSRMNAMQAVFFANYGSQPQLESQSTNIDPIQAVLYQNTPNPFKNETTIAYRLPSDIESAAICIYDLNGHQLKKYDLDVSVISNDVKVDGSTLSAGIYIYALIIDGQMADSKRMILTE